MKHAAAQISPVATSQLPQLVLSPWPRCSHISASVDVLFISVMKLSTSMYNFRFMSLMIPG